MDDRNPNENGPAADVTPALLASEAAPITNERSQNEQHQGQISTHLLHEAERTIAFTDAVVAIAMTLLILPLMDGASEMGEEGSQIQTTSDYFSENAHKLTSFLISFFAVALFWKGHERMFAHAGHFTAPLLRLNFIWMGGVVFFPVATSLMNQSIDGDKGGVVLYIGILMLVAFVNLLMCIIIRRDTRTWKEDAPNVPSVVNNVIIIFLLCVAMLVSLLVSGVGGQYSLLFLLARVPLSLIVQKLKPGWNYDWTY